MFEVNLPEDKPIWKHTMKKPMTPSEMGKKSWKQRVSKHGKKKMKERMSELGTISSEKRKKSKVDKVPC